MKISYHLLFYGKNPKNISGFHCGKPYRINVPFYNNFPGKVEAAASSGSSGSVSQQKM
jgi:hypothetical protein